jgi:hypothetical protein
MRRVVPAFVVLLACAAPALAQTPPSRVTIVSVFDPITYGDNAYVNGQLIGDGQSGQLVTLQASPFPFTAWGDVAQITTDYRGFYSFELHPAANTHYRTLAEGVMSEREVSVDVEPAIRFKAVPAGRSSVRFSGVIAPGHDRGTVAVQRQKRNGAWTTVANARLHGGAKFAGRLRARNPVVLRAFFASDGDHRDGFSRAVRVVP